MIFLKTAIFTVLLPGAGTILFPYLLLQAEILRLEIELGVLRYLGFAFVLMGVVFYISTTVGFGAIGKGTPAPIDPPKVLVVNGLYRYVRNPMYVGVLLILIGEAIYFEAMLKTSFRSISEE